MNGRTGLPDEIRNPQIRIDKIPVGGGIGALLVIIALIALMLVELPALRWPFLLGAVGGILLAAALILWRRFQSR